MIEVEMLLFMCCVKRKKKHKIVRVREAENGGVGGRVKMLCCFKVGEEMRKVKVLYVCV